MDELIRINYDSKRPTVYGRDLHEALQVKTAYKDWFPTASPGTGRCAISPGPCCATSSWRTS